jgi:hypothetical protein
LFGCNKEKKAKSARGQKKNKKKYNGNLIGQKLDCNGKAANNLLKKWKKEGERKGNEIKTGVKFTYTGYIKRLHKYCYMEGSGQKKIINRKKIVILKRHFNVKKGMI